MKNISIIIFLINLAFSVTRFDNWYINEKLNLLKSAPPISRNQASDILVSFPTINGENREFYIYRAFVMPEELTNRFNDIETYIGIGVNSASERVSLMISDKMIKAMILGDENNTFISGTNSSNSFKISDKENDYHEPGKEIDCGYEYFYEETSNSERDFEDCVGEDTPCFPIGDKLVTYRIAVIMTESVTNSVADGTVEGGIAWVASMINQLNLLWLRELSFKLELIPNNDILIFTDNNPAPGGASGFAFTWETCTESDGDPKYCELGNIKPYLDSVIGPGGDSTPLNDRFWEYGLLLNTIYNGGLAYVPGSTSANNPTYEVINHEMGHNLGSLHNISIEGGFSSSLGGTIMGSRSRTLSGNIGDQYSTHTIEIASRNFNNFSDDSYVKGYSVVETNHIIPEIIVPESGFYIPKETPFVLVGSSSPYESNYTFSWEQNDASSTSFCMDLTENAGECNGLSSWPSNEGPLFSTIDLSEDGYKRYFPSMKSLLNNEYVSNIDDYGTNLTVERLPFGDREINMRLQVRTNDIQSSAVNFKNVNFSVSNNAGPFRVTSQESVTNWASGSEQLVNWDVSNTNISPVNCSNVDIFLSTDAGRNFDITLIENTPNDGFENIILPMLASADSCRVMVKASDNIFFDINDANITISNSQVPNIFIANNNISLELPSNSTSSTEIILSNNGQSGSVLDYEIEIIDNTFLFEDFDSLALDESVATNEYSLPDGWTRSSNGRGWIIGTEETSAWEDWLLSQLNDMYFDIPEWSGGNYAFTDDEQYNICPSCTEYSECFSLNGCIDGSEDFLITPLFSIPSESSLKLSFDYWFQYQIGNQHDNILQVFTNGDWQNLDILNQSQNQFTNKAYDLSDYSGADFKLRFHSQSDESGDGLGGGWAIDNVLLFSTPNWVTSSISSGTLVSDESVSIPLIVNTNNLNPDQVYTTKVLVNDLINNLSEEVEITLEINDELDNDNLTPYDYFLNTPYPNPFNPKTTIEFSIPDLENVEITIYDIQGKKIEVITSEVYSPGNYSLEWNGEKYSSGVYFVKMVSENFIDTQKLMLMK